MSHRALLALLAILAVARCDCSERGRPGGDPDPDNAGDGGGGPGPDAGGPAPLDGGQADGGGDDASGNDDGGGDDAGDAGDDDDGGQEDPDGGQVDGGGPEADAGGGPLPGHVNSAPEIWSQPVTTARVGRPYRYAVLADDVDGDPLRFSLGAGPEGMTLDASGGLLAWVPPPGSAGSVQVTVEVQDPGGAGDAQPFELEVEQGEAPPRITSRPPLAAAPGADYRYEARAEDPDDAALAWSVTGPDGLAVSADGVVTWSVPADDAGAFPVELTARDAAGHEDVQAWAIGVARPGDRQPPTVRIDSPAAGARLETPVDVTGTATDEALAGYRLEACKT